MHSAFPRSVVFTAALFLLLTCGADAGNWPQWRGPHGTGVSDETGLPVRWGEGEGVVWKCSLPGEGASTPTVWGDAIFVTTEDGDKLLLLKIKAKGQVEWTRQVGTGTPRRIQMQRDNRGSR